MILSVLSSESSLFIFSLQMQSYTKMIGPRVMQQHRSIREHVAGNNETFKKTIADTASKNYSHVQDIGIFEHRNIPGPNIFFYHADKYQSDMHNQIEEFILRKLDQFCTQPGSSYAVAYIHDYFPDFLAFRRIVQKWPEHFFHRLRRVYIVGASMMVHIIETCSFGTFYRLCDELFLNLPDESSLKEADQAVLQDIRESLDPALKQDIKIEDNRIYGKNLSDYDLHNGKYPMIMLRLLARLVQRKPQLRIQGIFRKSCDNESLKKLENQLYATHWSAIDEQKDVIVVCGCLKDILYKLPVPLFNYDIYQRIIDFTGGDQFLFVRQLLEDMEQVNRKVFVLMVVFITDFVVSQKEWNKMTAYNMSVVFYPCFFRPKVYESKDLTNSSKFTKVLQVCFEGLEQLIDPAQRRQAQQILKSLQQGSIN